MRTQQTHTPKDKFEANLLYLKHWLGFQIAIRKTYHSEYMENKG